MKKVCPFCSINELPEDEELCSLSRDNKTVICDDCAAIEAMEDM